MEAFSVVLMQFQHSGHDFSFHLSRFGSSPSSSRIFGLAPITMDTINEMNATLPEINDEQMPDAAPEVTPPEQPQQPGVLIDALALDPAQPQPAPQAAPAQPQAAPQAAPKAAAIGRGKAAPQAKAKAAARVGPPPSFRSGAPPGTPPDRFHAPNQISIVYTGGLPQVHVGNGTILYSQWMGHWYCHIAGDTTPDAWNLVMPQWWSQIAEHYDAGSWHPR